LVIDIYLTEGLQSHEILFPFGARFDARWIRFAMKIVILHQQWDHVAIHKVEIDLVVKREILGFQCIEQLRNHFKWS